MSGNYTLNNTAAGAGPGTPTTPATPTAWTGSTLQIQGARRFFCPEHGNIENSVMYVSAPFIGEQVEVKVCVLCFQKFLIENLPPIMEIKE